MLLRVILHNFLSYRDKQEFTMFPNSEIEELPGHIMNQSVVPLLKMAVMYGNNASGKSNFVKALAFLESFVLSNKDIHKHDVWQHLFRLKDHSQISSSSLGILVEFKKGDAYYIYEIELDLSGVSLERLSKSALDGGTSKPIFERNYSSVSLSSELSNKTLSQWEHTRSVVENGLEKDRNRDEYRSLLGFLSDFPILEELDIQSAYNWFQQDLLIFSKGKVFNELYALLYRDKELMEFTSEIVKGINIGIDGLDLRVSDLHVWLNEHKELAGKINLRSLESSAVIHSFVYNDDRPIFNRILDDGDDEDKILELAFSHRAENDQMYELQIDDESDGSVKVLHLLPTLYFALKKGKTVVIDEMDSSLHSNLLLDLVAFFSRSSGNGQLLFTSHDTSLLDSIGVLRTDEVWFVEKRNGSSYLYALDSFTNKMENDISRKYREGRFGADYSGSLSF